MELLEKCWLKPYQQIFREINFDSKVIAKSITDPDDDF